MNRRDFGAIAQATKAELSEVGEAFQRDADPHKVLAGFVASVLAGAAGCSGFDRALFLKRCGVSDAE